MNYFISEHDYSLASLSSDRPMQKAAAQNLVKSNKALRNKADYLKRKVKSLQSELEKCKKDMCAESYMEISEKAGKFNENSLGKSEDG